MLIVYALFTAFTQASARTAFMGFDTGLQAIALGIDQDRPGIRPGKITYLLTVDSLANYRLIVINDKREVKRVIDCTKKVRIITGGQTLSGIIDSVAKDSILMNSHWIVLSQIDQMRVHTLGTNVAGITLTSIGAGATVLGIVLVIEGIQLLNHGGNNEFESFFATLFGLLSLGTGLLSGGTGLATTGAGITILVLGKNYNFDKNWKLVTEI